MLGEINFFRNRLNQFIFALVTFLKMDLIEQRAAIKFCVKLDHSATKTFDMLKKAYNDASLSRTSVFDWHKQFRL